MKTATVAVQVMEEPMKILSISELLCLTRMELIELRYALERQITGLPADSSEYRDSAYTLDNVRSVLARLDRERLGFPPRPSP